MACEAVRLFQDVHTPYPWRSVRRAPVLRLPFARGSIPRVDLQFVKGGLGQELGLASTGTLGFKTAKNGDYLVPSVAWTKVGSGAATLYTFLPSFLSNALDVALGNNDAVQSYGEIKWIDSTSGGYGENYSGFDALIISNVNRGGEVIPTSPSAWTNLTPSTTTSVEVSAAIGVVASIWLVAEVGVGIYTYKVVLITVGIPTGALADVYIELPASANPTIEVRNATAAGTLLHTVSGDSSNATYQHVWFRFNGTAWVKFGPAVS